MKTAVAVCVLLALAAAFAVEDYEEEEPMMQEQPTRHHAPHHKKEQRHHHERKSAHKRHSHKHKRTYDDEEEPDMEEEADAEEFIQYQPQHGHRHAKHTTHRSSSHPVKAGPHYKHSSHGSHGGQEERRHHDRRPKSAHRFTSERNVDPDDVIVELEEDGPGAAVPNPHLRDQLLHKGRSGVQSMPMAKKLRGGPHHHSHRHSHHKRRASRVEEIEDDDDEQLQMPADPSRHADEDDAPLDEFGLKKDCHWIQMDFTQHSDNCNQCMSVADAYFRGDDICVCYHDKPGAPMRTKCNEMAEKMRGDEDHIREMAVEKQWNEYYKSYGLCEAYGHCGGGV